MSRSPPYLLCSLVALLLLEPVVAKLRFPFYGGASAAAVGDAATSATGASSATSTKTPLLQSLFSPFLRKTNPWNWQTVQKMPGVQIPLQGVHWMKQLLLYKPPVGLVTVWTTYRLLQSGRLFRSWDGEQQGDATEQALTKKASRLDRHLGRALDLDKDDLEYQKFGGVERVRRRLTWKALEETYSRMLFPAAEQGFISSSPDSINHVEEELVITLLQLMKVTFPPGGSHADYVSHLIPLMAQAEQAYREVQYYTNPRRGDNNNNNNNSSLQRTRLLVLALQTAEVRALDGLLRLTRDRLLRTSFRLSRTVTHWKRRVQSQSGMWPIVRSFMAGSFEGDRMRLAFAESAYQSEITRLGKVVTCILGRPTGMDDSYLQLAVQKTLASKADADAGQQAEETSKQGKRHRHAHPAHPPSNSLVGGRWSLLSHRILPDTSNWSIRFNADGRGKIQVQKYDDSLHLGGEGAMEVLLEDSYVDQRAWLADAQDWSKQARKMIFGILEETVETSVQSTVEQEILLTKLKTTWMVQEYGGNQAGSYSTIVNDWNVLFDMVRDIHQFRRVGDGKSVKWKDANVIHWARQWDLLGIPSAALHILLARMVHNRLMPYWPHAKAIFIETFEVTNEIFQSRFYKPIRDLVVELMYRDTNTLLTGITLQDEEISLDYMLRDLDFGNGTPADRHDAILKATRQYEHDMKTGLMRHALGGRLIRLILIQVQQLKVGMLHAADTVDVLLQTNRFNIQLLAIIPAIVMVTVGTKVFFRFLFTLRHKDLRPMSSVHSEMAGYLDRLESILLLADDQSVTGRGGGNNSKEPLSALEALSEKELGEFVLNIYDYLVLLDYSSPQPFPSWQCDGIHQSIVEFLGPNGSLGRMTLSDQIRLVDHLKRKHEDLAKHL